MLKLQKTNTRLYTKKTKDKLKKITKITAGIVYGELVKEFTSWLTNLVIAYFKSM